MPPLTPAKDCPSANRKPSQLHNNAHTILGTVVVVALLLQPAFGYLHHLRYVKTQKKNAWTHLHVWYGRVLIVFGIINGGLGLRLARDTPAYSMAGTIVYAVFAGVFGGFFFGLVVCVVMRGGKSNDVGILPIDAWSRENL